MKHLVKTLLATFVGVLVLSQGVALSFAATQPVVGAISISQLTSDEPAILPNNPFYNIKASFLWIFGGTKLPDLVNNLNQKAAEVSKSWTVASDNENLIVRSLAQYQKSAMGLTNKIKGAKLADYEQAGNGDAGEFISRLEERLVTHLEFVDDLFSHKLTSSEQSLAIDIRAELRDGLVDLLSSVADVKDFRAQLSRVAVDANDFSDVRAAEVVSGVADNLMNNADLVTALNRTSDDLYINIAGRLEGAGRYGDADEMLASFGRLSGSPRVRLMSLAEILERVSSSEIKSGLNLIRAKLQEAIAGEQAMSDAEIVAIIQKAQAVADAIHFDQSAAFTGLEQLVSRAHFNAEQAAVLFDQGNPAGAYIQATMSLAASNNINLLLPHSDVENQDNIALIRQLYDSVSERAKAVLSDDSSDHAGQVNQLLAAAGTQIADVSAKIAGKKDSRLIAVNLRNIRLELAVVESLLAR